MFTVISIGTEFDNIKFVVQFIFLLYLVICTVKSLFKFCLAVPPIFICLSLTLINSALFHEMHCLNLFQFGLAVPHLSLCFSPWFFPPYFMTPSSRAGNFGQVGRENAEYWQYIWQNICNRYAHLAPDRWSEAASGCCHTVPTIILRFILQPSQWLLPYCPNNNPKIRITAEPVVVATLSQQ